MFNLEKEDLRWDMKTIPTKACSLTFQEAGHGRMDLNCNKIHSD